jgi:hypothetical protein
MARSRRTRYPRTEGKHVRSIFLVWALSAIATQIFRHFAPADRKDDAIAFFCVFSLIACIMWITDHVAAVGAAFGPFVTAAIVFEFVSSSKNRTVWLLGICLAPLLLVYAAYGSLVIILPSWAILASLPFLFHLCTFRQLLIRFPRYRQDDPFANSNLCDPCRTVFKSSRLLLGSWMFVVRTEEVHPFYKSIDDMRRSWQGCQLCEALLNQSGIEEVNQAASTVRSGNYGTISSAASVRSLSALEDGSLKVKIQLRKGSSFRTEFGLQFTVKLQSPDMIKFRELIIAEGMHFFPNAKKVGWTS